MPSMIPAVTPILCPSVPLQNVKAPPDEYGLAPEDAVAHMVMRIDKLIISYCTRGEMQTQYYFLAKYCIHKAGDVVFDLLLLKALEFRKVFLQFPVMHLHPVAVPLDLLRLHEPVVSMLPKRTLDYLVPGEFLQRLL